jgi:hypothetical protein
MPAEYDIACKCLQENLVLLMGPFQSVAPENQTTYNMSNAMLVILDALKENEERLRSVELLLQGLSAKR